jgi:hypothetical protein
MNISILVRKLIQSKSFSFRDPKSQLPETDLKLSIRLKKIKQHYVVFNSPNLFKELISKLSYPLLSLPTVNTLTHCCDTSTVITQLILTKCRQRHVRNFQVRTTFLDSL